MAMLSLQAVASATGGTMLCGDPGLTVERYAIDSRHIRGGELFFALVGERNDGHDYLDEVFRRGAAAAVVSRPQAPAGPAVRVADTTAALRTLAHHVRQDWGGTVIGITGSCGKTTTKEMLRQVLAASRPVLATRGNYNNLYGLPLMLLELMPEHQAAVLEMGISTPGEMAPLTAIACPDVAVLLNVEAVHLVHFSSVDEILTTKAAILEALRPGGTFVYNADDPRVAALAAAKTCSRLSFGQGEAAQVRATDILSRGGEGLQARVHHEGRSSVLRLPVAGRHNLMNALAALAAARVVGVPLDQGCAALERFRPAAMRGERLTLPVDVVVWDESYNSNPAALRAVLDTLAESPGRGRRVLVCGDMLELGEDEEQRHLEMAAPVMAAGISLLVSVGPLSAALARRLQQEHGMAVAVCRDAEEAARVAVDRIRDGDTVVVKGSRGMRTDKVVAALQAARGGGEA